MAHDAYTLDFGGCQVLKYHVLYIPMQFVADSRHSVARIMISRTKSEETNLLKFS